VSGIESIAAAMPAITSAIGTAMDAFSGMIHLARNAKDWASGIAGYKYTDQEHYAINRGGPGSRDIQEKAAGYGEVMRDILSKESATGPTDAAVESAIRNTMRKGPLTPGQQGAKAAAEAYISDRGIAPYVIDRVRGQIVKQEGIEAGDRLKAREAGRNQYMDRLDAITAQDEFFKRFGEVIRGSLMDVMRPGAFGQFGYPTPHFNIDGSKAGSALDNAYRYRRR
jgi:hypothetical protein